MAKKYSSVTKRVKVSEHCSSMGNAKVFTVEGEEHGSFGIYPSSFTDIDVRTGGELEVTIRVIKKGKRAHNPFTFRLKKNRKKT